MKQIQRSKVDTEFEFCKKFHNKVMMSYGDSRLYYLDPKEKDNNKRSWDNVIWVLFGKEKGDL